MNLFSDFTMAAQSSTVFHYLDIGRMGRGEVVK